MLSEIQLEVLEEFKKYWERSPNLRFGQMITNIVNVSMNKGVALYYTPDDKFLATLLLSKKHHVEGLKKNE